jgi:hypothetical protein
VVIRQLLKQTLKEALRQRLRRWLDEPTTPEPDQVPEVEEEDLAPFWAYMVPVP